MFLVFFYILGEGVRHMLTRLTRLEGGLDPLFLADIPFEHLLNNLIMEFKKTHLKLFQSNLKMVYNTELSKFVEKPGSNN